MNDFKKSFSELKKGKVLLHYAIGSFGIVLMFYWLMHAEILKSGSSPFLYGILFFVIYALIDRLSHAILKLH